MAAKAQRRTRQRRRRGRFGGLYKLLSLLIVFTAVLVGCVIFFRVNTITVTGNSRYTMTQVITASGIREGDNLFLINRPKTAGAIVTKLPYVESVAPIKILPDKVELRITETRALCAVQGENGWWLLNAGAKLLEQGGEELKGDLPPVLGLTPHAPALGTRMTVEGADQAKLEGLKALLSALDKRGLSGNITGFIDFTGNNTIYFGYGDELTVAVPMSGDFERRIHSLQRVVQTFEEQGEWLAGTLDLTYGDEQARLLPERWLPLSMRPPEPELVPEGDAGEEPEDGPEKK